MIDQEKKRQKWLRAYYKNRDAINEKSRNYHKSNREKLNLYRKNYLSNNPEQKQKLRNRIKKWRLKNNFFTNGKGNIKTNAMNTALQLAA